MEGIIFYGGAWSIPKELHTGHIKGCRQAADVGFDYINDATEAATEAVACMEDK